ncbi:GNAT family N-acetyltransferase [Staphylococcus sp. NAM3COL9]|uniref:GNAT family N-acetyltransferase n=1 Tax=Staphylococcus sp. NAM3COL9 TaxID=1667172 RepID=UPI00070AAFB6|nr:GNAT family N-acetyltransferase [Staphylococcus sp. NAM3COL9]KRG10810.1 hypothetical protein ACA31_02320 [Staphylococcus sp. NAM3COL9]
MNLQFNHITKRSVDLKKVEDLFYQSFPKDERLSIDLLLYKADLGFGKLLAVYDNNSFVGFTYLVTYENLTYILYLAVDESHQSKGYGGRILSLIKDEYCQNQLVLNIETLDESAPNFPQRLKRKNFYNRNGYNSAKLIYKNRFGVYEVMVNGEGNVNKDTFKDLMKNFADYSLFLYLEVEIN